MALVQQILIFASVVALVSSALSRPRFIECSSSSECTVDHCCVLGMHKFSVPRCQLLGQRGDTCRVNASPRNATLFYPTGQSVEFVDVHSIMCPCALGFYCSEKSGTCTDMFDGLPNSIDEEYNA